MKAISGRASVSVALVFFLLAGCSASGGPSSVVMAQYQSQGVAIRLECVLVRPLTGSFWGIRGNYEAHFVYSFAAPGSLRNGVYATTILTDTKDLMRATPACQGRATELIPVEDGNRTRYTIRVNGRHLASLHDDGTLEPGP